MFKCVEKRIALTNTYIMHMHILYMYTCIAFSNIFLLTVPIY